MTYNKTVRILLASAFALAVFAPTAFAATAPAKSLYLVEGVGGAGVGPGGLDMMQTNVLPGLDMLSKMVANKTILAGGVVSGDRAGVFIVEASSSEEVDKMLLSIPLWPLLQWKVTPLASFSSRAALHRTMMEQMKTKQN